MSESVTSGGLTIQNIRKVDMRVIKGRKISAHTDCQTKVKVASVFETIKHGSIKRLTLVNVQQLSE